LRVLLYLLAIVGANVVTASLPPTQIWVFLIPFGTWFIGATFILRDLVQQKHGRKTAYMAIFGALLMSVVLSVWQGNLVPITLASGLSFALSESIDTEIFTRIKTTFANRVELSGMVGGLFDSAFFVVIGLSPIGAGFMPWEAVPMAIIGQWLVKSLLQLIGAAIIKAESKRWS
jgi:uncharacterized PurR-regulated membrane protein YhhQ (DUF165 family)